MKRLICAVVTSAVVLCSCAERSRPDPTSPDSRLVLTADVLEPRTSETVLAGAMLDIRVHATERASRLTGVGFVARLFGTNAPPLDSVAVRFGTIADTTHVFPLRIPAYLATNTQIDISGLAFGPTEQTARSSTQSVVVIACPPGGTACR
jgi:hypothetical protein